MLSVFNLSAHDCAGFLILKNLLTEHKLSHWQLLDYDGIFLHITLLSLFSTNLPHTSVLYHPSFNALNIVVSSCRFSVIAYSLFCISLIILNCPPLPPSLILKPSDVQTHTPQDKNVVSISPLHSRLGGGDGEETKRRGALCAF